MNTSSLFAELQRHPLLGAKTDFARARVRQPALADYRTPEAVVATLQGRRPSSAASANDLVTALLVEVNAGARSLGEVLLKGFLPRLALLRDEAEKVTGALDLLEPLLTTAFLEATAAFPGVDLEPDASGYLLQECRRRFLPAARELSIEEASLVPVGLRVPRDEPSPWTDYPLATGGPVESANDPGGFIDAPSEFLVRVVDGRLRAERLDLVVATVVHDERVVEYVRRRFPRLQGRARKNACARQGQLRRYAVRQLRHALTAWQKDPRDWVYWA